MLGNLKKSDPKSFWKEISSQNSKDPQYGDRLMSLDDFAKHFRMLNLDKSAHVSNRKANKNKINLSIEGHGLTLEDEYKYLGLIFSFNGRFIKTLNRLKIKLKKLCMPLLEICEDLTCQLISNCLSLTQ